MRKAILIIIGAGLLLGLIIAVNDTDAHPQINPPLTPIPSPQYGDRE